MTLHLTRKKFSRLWKLMVMNFPSSLKIITMNKRLNFSRNMRLLIQLNLKLLLRKLLRRFLSQKLWSLLRFLNKSNKKKSLFLMSLNLHLVLDVFSLLFLNMHSVFVWKMRRELSSISLLKWLPLNVPYYLLSLMISMMMLFIDSVNNFLIIKIII